MKKIAAAVLALGVLACCLPVSSACLRDPGPCYGYGCPGFGVSHKTYDVKATKDEKSKDQNVAADDNSKPAATDQQASTGNATK